MSLIKNLSHDIVVSRPVDSGVQAPFSITAKDLGMKVNLFGRLDGLSLAVIGFVALISFPFLGIGLYEAYENRKKINAFIHTTGTVIENSYATTHQDGTLSGAYYPVVEFTQANGELVRFSDGIGSLPPDYAVGVEVPIAYNPKNPKDARIYTWKRIWFVPTLFIVIGLLPPVIAFVIMRAVKQSFKVKK